MVVALVLAAACNGPVQELRKVVRAARRTGPQIPATVVTLRTTLQPANKATTTTIVIADDLARSTEEVGEWRLFDVKENRVAFVNDFAKTYRYESLESMRDRHDDASSEPLYEKIPRAEYAVTAERRDILGVPATKSIVKLGGYQRAIWFGSHPLIPPQLFSLMQASGAPGPDAPVSKRLDDAFLSSRGFPLADHAELPYANTKIVVDRDVVSIERKNIAASLLDIPETYREVEARGTAGAEAGCTTAGSADDCSHDDRSCNDNGSAASYRASGSGRDGRSEAGQDPTQKRYEAAETSGFRENHRKSAG